MKSRYALGPSVTPDKSKSQIEKALRAYGCKGVMQGYDESSAFLAFMFGGLQIRMIMPLPDSEKLQRQRYRVLLVNIKAKFESIACGLKTFEEEFIGDIVMPNGMTLAQAALPQLRKAIADGKMPSKLLPMLE